MKCLFVTNFSDLMDGSILGENRNILVTAKQRELHGKKILSNLHGSKQRSQVRILSHKFLFLCFIRIHLQYRYHAKIDIMLHDFMQCKHYFKVQETITHAMSKANYTFKFCDKK